MSSFTLDEFVPLLKRESRARRGIMLAIFALVSIALLAVAFFWQKTYVSSVTLFVDDTNIVKPLLEGVAAASSQRDKASVAKEVLFSREILENIVGNIATNGSAGDTAIQKEEMMIEIANRTSVQNINSTLLVISYEDKNPEVAYETVRLYADLFLDKTMRAQSVESSDAFEFIVNQVETYRGKLEDAEIRLEDFRGQYPGARPGTEGNVDERIIELRRQLEQTELQYGEMNQRRKTLSSELANESSTLEQEYRESQFRDQINELQAQVDLLRLNYTDDYPDIIRLNQQIADFTQLAQGEAARRAQARQNGVGNSFSVNGSVYSGASNLSPVYQALKGDLSRATAETNSLLSRLTQTRALLEKELSRAQQSTKVERELAELSRDYTINKDIYEQLVKRRESARVSMSLGQEKQGVLYRIQEAANFPVLPNGLRFMHIALAGLLLGAALPFVYLIGFLKLDPRIRTASAITDDLQLPLLTVVPHMQLPGSKTPWSQQPIAAAVVICGVLVVFAVVGWIKYSQGIV